MNVVLRFDAAQPDGLRAFLHRGDFRIEQRPHALFFATRPGVSLTAYASGKLLVTGAQAEEYAGVLVGNGLASREGSSPLPSPPTSPPLPLRSPSGWVLHFDGACMPVNPGGAAAYGFVVLRDGVVVHEGHGLAAPPGPAATNNVAEFRGLVEGLKWLRGQGAREVLVRGDSQLVVDTMLGRKRLVAPHLVSLRDEARALHMAMGGRIEWVPREENAEADRMSRVGWEAAVRAHPEWRL